MRNVLQSGGCTCVFFSLDGLVGVFVVCGSEFIFLYGEIGCGN